ncbi:hypothetical protein C0991_008687, partial [Blastosporella zonata]
PLESELAKQVEYDMDEQDKAWLDTLNAERKKDQLSNISYELFEIVMDRLEKEWFDLTKNITKPDLAMPSEDSTCAVCDDSEGENINAIVFCDGCNLAVHQDCYGIPYIPEGQWLCRKCTVSPENPVSCLLCPNEGGAFKQTVNGDWVHLLCAIWVAETRVVNESVMEPVTGVDNIPHARWKLKCSICHIKGEGACIQCIKTSCFQAFHATCARRQRLLSPMKAAQGTELVSLTCYCDKHLPKEQQEVRAAALAADDALQDSPTHNAKMAKSARAYAKTYKPGPPLVPAVVVQRIDYYIRRFKLSKRLPTLHMMCRYWSLKREARRGAPLLKRLHLEPWTANAGGRVQTDEEKVMKLDQLNHLLYDMEGLKDLTFSTKKRERWKLEQVRAICDVLDNSIFVYERQLRIAFERITSLDRNEYFKNPVSKAEVPDYFDVIKRPMCWVTIEERLNKHEYWDVQAFKDDIDLVLNNAMKYNGAGTAFHKAALRFQNAAAPILEDLRQRVNPTGSTYDDAVGDIEPPLELLELLLSTEVLQDEMDLILEDTPLASMFSYALPKIKPPPKTPTPSPPAPKSQKSKSKSKSKSKKRRADALGEDVAPVQYTIKRRTRASAAAFDYPEEEQEQEQEPIEEDVADEPMDETAEGIEEPPDVSMHEETTQIDEPPSVEEEQPIQEEAPLVSISTAPAKRGPRQSRNDLPLVNDVDNRQSFKMFNDGWILPPEQKRGGRVSMNRQAAVPAKPPTRPRKRMRTDAGPSRLSVVSTAATESQALTGTPAPAEEAPPPASAAELLSPPPAPLENEILAETSPAAEAPPPAPEADLSVPAPATESWSGSPAESPPPTRVFSPSPTRATSSPARPESPAQSPLPARVESPLRSLPLVHFDSHIPADASPPMSAAASPASSVYDTDETELDTAFGEHPAQETSFPAEMEIDEPASAPWMPQPVVFETEMQGIEEVPPVMPEMQRQAFERAPSMPPPTTLGMERQQSEGSLSVPLPVSTTAIQHSEKALSIPPLAYEMEIQGQESEGVPSLPLPASATEMQHSERVLSILPVFEMERQGSEGAPPPHPVSQTERDETERIPSIPPPDTSEAERQESERTPSIPSFASGTERPESERAPPIPPTFIVERQEFDRALSIPPPTSVERQEPEEAPPLPISETENQTFDELPRLPPQVERQESEGASPGPSPTSEMEGHESEGPSQLPLLTSGIDETAMLELIYAAARVDLSEEEAPPKLHDTDIPGAIEQEPRSEAASAMPVAEEAHPEATTTHDAKRRHPEVLTTHKTPAAIEPRHAGHEDKDGSSEEPLILPSRGTRGTVSAPAKARRSSGAPPPPLSSRVFPGTERIIEENGRKIRETLDTPQLRKKKRKDLIESLKQQMQIQNAAGGSGSAGASGSQDAQIQSSISNAGETVTYQEMGSLSQVGSDYLQGSTSASVSARGKKARGRPTGWQTRPALEPELERVLVKEGDVLEGGTIVWAQAQFFPWWPGVIWDYKDFPVPMNIKRKHEVACKKTGKQMYVIQFFDKGRTWAVIPHEDLRLLGEDPALDEDMVATKSKRQTAKWANKWTGKSMQDCRDSYHIALKEMETPSDVERGANAVVPTAPIIGTEETEAAGSAGGNTQTVG